MVAPTCVINLLEHFSLSFMYDHRGPFDERELTKKDTILNCWTKQAVERVVCFLSACADWSIAECHSNLSDTLIPSLALQRL